MFRKIVSLFLVLGMLCGVVSAEYRLPTNRATVLVVGPCVDYEDGVTPETAMTVTNITCELYKMSDAGGTGTAPTRTAITLAASGTSNDMVHIASDVGGYYSLELTAAQLNFVGRARLCLTDADVMCPVWEDLIVEPNNVYDSGVSGTDLVQADVQEWKGVTPEDLATTSDVWSAGTRTLTALDEDDTTIDLDGSAVGSVTGNVGGSVASVTTVSDKTGYSLAADQSAVTIGTVTTLTGHTAQTGDSYARLGAPAGASVSADVAAVKSETASILADTGTDGVVVGSILQAAIAQFFSLDSGTDYDSAVSGSVVKEVASHATTQQIISLVQLGGTGVGAGPIEWEYTVTNSSTGLPVASATVWVSTDSAGRNVIAQTTTDNSGVATFYLTAGDYYVWRAKAGMSFTNPDSETVSEE